MNMEGIDMIVNSLPAPTWEKLGMNRANIHDLKINTTVVPNICGDCEMLAAEDAKLAAFAGVETGMGEEVGNLVRRVVSEVAYAEKDGTTLLRYDFKNGENSAAGLAIYGKSGSSKTVIMDFSSEDSQAAGDAVVQTLIKLEKDAELTLVQVVRVGDDYRFLNDVGAVCADGAAVKYVQLYLAGDKVYSGNLTTLEGAESKMESNLGYELTGARVLDMNYIARHIGKNTDSRITAMGSLKDNSAKIFRGTIDFVNGSAGAVGNENEEVLILDDGAINKTIPLILCAEEDVEGNHGASIGRPDEDILFYFASRGIDEEEACRILCRAKLDAAAAHIPDDKFRIEITNYIHRDCENCEVENCKAKS